MQLPHSPSGQAPWVPIIRAEIASTTDFQTVLQSHQLPAPPPRILPPGDQEDAEAEADTCQWIFYPAAEDQFLRLTPIGPHELPTIESVEVWRGTLWPGTAGLRSHETSTGAASTDGGSSGAAASESSDSRVAASGQSGGRVRWVLKSNRWPEELTADYQDLAKDGFADLTASLFRVQQASLRIAENAGWIGYNQVRVPGTRRLLADPDGEQPGEAQANAPESDDVSSQLRFSRQLTMAALRRWARSDADGRLVLADPASTAAETAPPRTPDSTTTSDVASSITNPPVRCRCATVARDLGDRLVAGDARRIEVVTDRVLPPMYAASRRALAEFALVPLESVVDLPPSDASSDYLTVRLAPLSSAASTDGRLDGHQVVVINRAVWPADVQLRLQSLGSSGCQLLWPHADASELRRGATTDTWIVRVRPMGTVNLRITGGLAPTRPLRWRATMVGGEETLQTIKSQVGDVVSKLGLLSQPSDYPQLRNGGFEVDGQVGIVGWMHTQFPPTAVVIDDAEAVEGGRSIRMTTDIRSADRAWLVSEPIEVPASGRLAVSLATRAQATRKLATRKQATESQTDQSQATGQAASTAQANDSAPVDRSTNGDPADDPAVHQIRVSFEGNRAGQPVRFVTELAVPRDGKWHPRRIVLEADDLDADEFDPLRLTIDSLSAGRLWIDDVHLHDHFPSHSERAALQGKAFLAVQGLQHGQFNAAAELLRNDWSQELLASGPISEPATGPAAGDPAMRPADATDIAATPAGAGDAAAGKAAGPPRSGTDAFAKKILAGGQSSEQAGDWPREMPRINPVPIKPLTEAKKKSESVAERLRGWLPRPLRF